MTYFTQQPDRSVAICGATPITGNSEDFLPVAILVATMLLFAGVALWLYRLSRSLDREAQGLMTAHKDMIDANLSQLNKDQPDEILRPRSAWP